MASSFFGGFASSLASSLGQRAQQEQAQKDWEWKAKKAAELEEQMASTRKVSSKVFEQNGQHFVQSFNAADEPVGQPIPASPARIEEYNQGIENRELELAKQRAAKAADEARAANLEAETRTIKEREARADRESQADIAQSGAAAAYNNALARAAGLNADRDKMINDEIKNNPSLITSLAETTAGGGRVRTTKAEDEVDKGAIAAALVKENDGVESARVNAAIDEAIRVLGPNAGKNAIKNEAAAIIQGKYKTQSTQPAGGAADRAMNAALGTRYRGAGLPGVDKDLD